MIKNIFLFSLLLLFNPIAAESKQNETTQKELQSPKSFTEEGLYVAAWSYYPAIPPNPYPNNAPSQYLKSHPLSEQIWKRSEEPIFLFIPPNALLIEKEEAKWKKGLQLSTPLTIYFDPYDKKFLKPIKISGALLLRIESIHLSYEELEGNYPPKMAKPNYLNLRVITFSEEDGLFESIRREEGGIVFLNGGPLEEGWSEAMQIANVNLWISFYSAFGCFIATEIYDSSYSEELTILRAFRDEVLVSTEAGQRLIGYYYRYGPYLATILHAHPALKEEVKAVLSLVVRVLKMLDWDDPTIRAGMNQVIEWTDQILSPYLQEEEQLEPDTIPSLMKKR